jgi:hypothetical protein
MEVSGQLHAPAALPSGKGPPVRIGEEAGCTFHNVVEKRNPYQSKNRFRRPEPTPVSLLCPPYNISIMASEGTTLVSAHASMVYAM